MHPCSTPPITFSVSFINEGSGILQKVVVARAGRVKSYNEEIDEVTLSQIVSLGNAKPKGIKARFGHPNMCTSAFGTYIGRFKNFMAEGDKVTADLYLDPICRTSPSGNLYDYILTMAAKNPDMFGASMAFIPAPPVTGQSEFPLVRIEELLATDLVDDPAATDSLFSRNSFASIATGFLDQNPALSAYIAARPVAIIEFMVKYFSTNNRMKPEILRKLKNLFAATSPGADPTLEYEHAIELLEADHQEALKKLETAGQQTIENLEASHHEAFNNQEAANKQAIENLEAGHRETLQNLEAGHREALETLEASHQQAISALRSEHQATMASIETTNQQNLEKLKTEHQETITTLGIANTQAIDTLKTTHAAELETLQATHRQELESQEATHNTQITELNTRITTLHDQLKATPTTVNSTDPELTLHHNEEKFGIELLNQIPPHLKTRLKRK